MNYYPHHIGDFRSGTFNMTRQERWIYRDMIDVYYDTEGPFPDSLDAIYKMMGVRRDEDKEVVAAILLLKFELRETGYHHVRCDEEIAAYRLKAEVAQNNGKKGGRPPKNNPVKPSGLSVGSSRVIDGNPELTGSKANQEPRTNNQEPVNQNTPIPPEGGDAGKRKTSAIALKTYIAECKAQGVNPIPEGDPVFDYVEKVGIPEDFLRLQWMEFKDRYTMPDAKRYKAWRTVFLKSIKGNWFKIWYVSSDGQYLLTTVGQQADRDHKDAA